MTVLIVTAVLAWISALCWMMNLPNPIEKIISNRDLSGYCEIGAITIFSIWCFLWLPFRRHEAEQAKFSKLEHTEQEKKGKQMLLAHFVNKLETRIIEVGNIGFWFYKDEAKKKACANTDEMTANITDILETFFDPITAARFSNVKPSSIQSPAIADIPTQQKVELDRHISYLENQKKELLEIGKSI